MITNRFTAVLPDGRIESWEVARTFSWLDSSTLEFLHETGQAFTYHAVTVLPVGYYDWHSSPRAHSYA